jgi:hypothetical protein
MYEFSPPTISVSLWWLQNFSKMHDVYKIVKAWWILVKPFQTTTSKVHLITKLKMELQALEILLNLLYGRQGTRYIWLRWILIMHGVLKHGMIFY